ncbi:hypothetical protein CHS0354_036760 [Potamilus streckersoni]|uniref:Uncharacterized protein n=1 Tax=Potamilus streckersoni TaxID=2493646 RepID=A0AAE0S5G2_9BIVA|nr:hypothetical protein CHS0354_036760 [Potamilus streckersoni]
MFGDDTALNAIRLSCTTQKGQFVKELITAEGPWGDWYNWGYCSNDSKAFAFLIAFDLKVELNQGDSHHNSLSSENLESHVDLSNNVDPRDLHDIAQSGEGLVRNINLVKNIDQGTYTMVFESF